MTASDRDIRICFVGDSFVAGLGDETGLGWVGRVTTAALALRDAQTLVSPARLMLVGPPAVDDNSQNNRIAALDLDMRDGASALGIPFVDFFNKPSQTISGDTRFATATAITLELPAMKYWRTS